MPLEMEEKPRVLYISPNGYMGGAERFVCNAVTGHLNHRNVNVQVLFFSDGHAVTACENAGAKVHVLPMSFKMKNIFQLLKALFYIRRFIKKNKFDVVHSTMPYAHIMAFFSTMFMNIKRVWFQHGPVGGTLDQIANYLPVDKILFNSKYLQDEHLKMLHSARNIPKHKIVKYGIRDEVIDFNEVTEIQNKYKKEKVLLLAAGRICSWKGYHIIIEALHLLLKSHLISVEDFQLIIVGDYARESDKAYYEEIQDMIKKYKLQESILMIGQKIDIQNYFTASDVFIHSSTIPEPFGLVVAEAMKYDCFVLGSNQGGISDILIHGQTGFSFNPTVETAPEDLSKLILQSLKLIKSDRDSFSEFIQTGKDIITNQYNPIQMIESLEEEYI